MILFNFALDRIIDIQPVDQPFRDNDKFDREHFFDNVIGVSKNIQSRPTTIRFWANKEQSYYIRTKPIHCTQRLISRAKDKSCIFEICVVINFELYSVLMSYGAGLRVISPTSVAEYMRDKLQQAYTQYLDEDFQDND